MSSNRAGLILRRRRLGNKSLLIACGGIGLVISVVWFILTFLAVRGVPALAGRVTIQADPEVKIYVGETLYGTGNVSFSWKNLLAKDALERLAIEASPESDAVTAAACASPGGRLLYQETLTRCRTNTLHFTVYQFLLRRADGQLDPVLVLHVDLLRSPRDLQRRFFIPIRARQRRGDAAVFLRGSTRLSVASRAEFLKLIGRSPTQLTVTVVMYDATPPDQIAQEISEKGLWEPSVNQSAEREFGAASIWRR